MRIKCSAPGKLILFGEHASSRNKPAIVFAVNKRLEAELIPNEKHGKGILLSSEILKIVNEQHPSKRLDLVSKTIETFFKETKCPMKSFDIRFTSKIPAGFGSSAAVVAATLGVLDCFYNTHLAKYDLLEMGIKANHAIKGYGSGLDIGAAIYGGLIKYKIGDEPINLPYSNLNLIIGNTKIKSPSGPIVESVRNFELCNATLSHDIFNQIEKIVNQAEIAINSGNIDEIGKLMDKNQELLRIIDISSPILEELILAAKQNGALGAKLSGAGIGDNMIALVTEDIREKVIEAINTTKGKVIEDIAIDPNGLIIK